MEYVVSFLKAVVEKKKFKNWEELKSFIHASKHLMSTHKQKLAHSKVCELLEATINKWIKMMEVLNKINQSPKTI